MLCYVTKQLPGLRLVKSWNARYAGMLEHTGYSYRNFFKTPLFELVRWSFSPVTPLFPDKATSNKTVLSTDWVYSNFYTISESLEISSHLQ